ncbi:hypothetical protein ACFWDG_25075 [Peribacillus sp. NPDC060186]
MGIPPALTAGMVVSGAIFGNKISSFADTTNLAVAVTGAEHIKMRSLPSLLLTSRILISLSVVSPYPLLLSTVVIP